MSHEDVIKSLLEIQEVTVTDLKETETDIHILRCKRIRKTAIAYPRFLLVCTTRCLFRLLIVVVLFTNSQKEMLLKSKMGIHNKQGQLLVVTVDFEVGRALISTTFLNHLIPMATDNEGE